MVFLSSWHRNPFIQQTCGGCLRCARHCSRYWEYVNKREYTDNGQKQSLLWSAGKSAQQRLSARGGACRAVQTLVAVDHPPRSTPAAKASSLLPVSGSPGFLQFIYLFFETGQNLAPLCWELRAQSLDYQESPWIRRSHHVPEGCPSSRLWTTL